MTDKLTGIIVFFRKIPAPFLVAIDLTLVLILFIPDEIAKALAVDEFRESYRVFLGPVLLLFITFSVARIFMFISSLFTQRKFLKNKQQLLHKLTPEEKGYLVRFIKDQQNSVYVGLDDGIMSDLKNKEITYLATNTGHYLRGFAFNLQPWAREYLENNPDLLINHIGEPMTPGEKSRSRIRR